MDSWQINKIAGAVLGTCLVGMGIGIVAQGIYEPGAPKKPGYALPEPKETAGAGGEAKAEVVPIAVRLEKADPKKGEAEAKVCSACHNFQEGAGAKVGPDLWDVVDRPKGKAEGFDYSAGMKAKGGNWTYADLDTFLTKPSAYVQGTKMGYPGQDDPEKRASIIAYLRSLAKEPKPLPKVSDADKKVASADAKGGSGVKGGDKGNGAGAAAGEGAFLKVVGEADPKKGQAAAQVCTACHNVKKGAGNLIGPDLWDVVNRKKGSVEGFDYSAGMKAKGGEWTFDDLNAWLTKPSAYVPGTKMGYPGEANEKKRAEIIAWLRTLADNPVALPGTDKGANKAEADHPGETKAMVPEAKPGDQKPPAPPSPPGAKQPAPQSPEPSSAAGAPQQPDERKPDMPAPAPTHDKDPPPGQKSEAAPVGKPEREAKAVPAEGASTVPEPYQAVDPVYAASSPAEPIVTKIAAAAPSLTPAGDKDDGDAAGPEPYAAATPGESK